MSQPLTSPDGDRPDKRDGETLGDAGAQTCTCPNGHPLPRADAVCSVCGTLGGAENIPPPTAPLQVRIPGYEILGELGRGGMGVVYEARQLSLNRSVALKMLQGSAFAGPKERARFRREAEVLAHMQHANIVQIFEVGEHHGHPYFTMELVGGGGLERKLAGKPQPARATAELVAVLARAVQAAHERGIVHRDLKPANVLLTPDGTPKITDFGLAKQLQPDALHPPTASGAVLGTPPYMCPEQAAGQVHRVGPAADVYALGAILYELLTARPPFLAETPVDTLMQVLAMDPVPPSRLRRQVPRDLETICLKCLEKEPRRRYASARALADDLARFLAGEPIEARPVGPLGRARKWVLRHPTRALALGLVLALVGVLSLGLWAQVGRLRDQARHREQLRQTVSAYEGKVSAQLADVRLEPGFFDQAEEALGAAVSQLEGEQEPDLVGRRTRLLARLDRVHRLGVFCRRADEAWFRAGEERYRDSCAAGAAALQALGIMTSRGRFPYPDWWQHLPADDLQSGQRHELEGEVYRQLLLLTQMRAMPWLNPEKWKTVQAAEAYRSAEEALDQARALEQAGRVPPAQTVRLFRKFLRSVSGRSPPKPGPARAGGKGPSGPTNPADYFFSGSVHYFIGRAQLAQAPKPSRPPGDGAWGGLLAGIGKVTKVKVTVADLIRAYWGKDLDFRTPLVTAEEQLRVAISREPRRFWAYFMLGRIHHANGDYRGAESAFDTCVALRPEFPVSYQLRALAISRQALQATGKRRDDLLRRALADARRAVDKGSGEPAIYWTRAEMFAALDRVGDALEAYGRGLELEEDILGKVSRRSVLNDVEAYTGQVIGDRRSDADVRADAHAVRALLFLRRKDHARASADARRALELHPGHRRAQQVLDAVRRAA